MGFLDTILTITDANNDVGTIRLSPLAKPVRINAIDTTSYGLVRLTMNQPAEEVDVMYAGEYLARPRQDSLKLYYQSPLPDTFLAGRNGIFVDTAFFYGAVSPPAPPPQLESGPGGRMNPAVGLVFTFNQPLGEVDSSRINLLLDTFPDRRPISWRLDTVYPGQLTITHGGKPNDLFNITLLPGAVSNIWGIGNRDTIRRKYNLDSPEKYGTLTLKVNQLDTTATYLLRLLDKDKILPGTGRTIDRQSDFEVLYPGLKPGTYRVEIILDRNRNGRYDGGDFLLGRQPEPIQRFELPELRPNWEVEEVISLEE